MALCKDPKTGKIENVPGNSCPSGWVMISPGTIPVEESTTSSSNTSNYYVPWPSGQTGTGSPYVVPPQRYEVGRAESAWVSLPAATKRSIQALAKSIDRRKTGQGLFLEAVQAAKYTSAGQNPQTPFDILNQMARDYSAGVYGATPSGGSGRGGAYTGPVRSVTVQAESDIRATADAIGMEMLGRGVSDEEFKRILKRTRKAEQAQPDITTSGVSSRETQQGLSAQGRQDIVQNILAKKPEYEEFQKATTLMSWFDRALQERMQQ